MTVTADVVVAGAGHNSLITAAYLAKSGREVVVVDARPVPGGGAATEELLQPGYHIDSCSTGHTLIQNNPVLAKDELGLISEHGLTYIDPDPVGHVVFPDGESLTMWLDRDATLAEISRFSARDADTYQRFISEWEEVAPLFGAATNTPVGFGPPLDERLRQHPRGGVWRRRIALSAWDVIRREFESRHVRTFLMWQAFQTLVPLDLPGSGQLAYSILAGRQRRSWTIPKGGSGKLTDALVAVIRKHGGTVLTDRTVRELIVENGRCTGFVTTDGERYVGRDAVVSTIHVKHLIDMAPADAWDEAFRYGVETFDPGIPAFVIYLGTTEPPRFRAAGGGTQTAVSAGLAAWPEDLIRVTRDIRDGNTVTDTPWVLVGTPSLDDPTRAPGDHHTVKVIVAQSHIPPRGAASWEELKEQYADELMERVRGGAPNLTGDVTLGRLVRSPVDIEAANPHMINGTFHGGDRSHAFSGPLRPAPGWASHRMPIPGLYQTGGTTHPGGSITGTPGRNAAQVILKDLGTSLEAVVNQD